VGKADPYILGPKCHPVEELVDPEEDRGHDEHDPEEQERLISRILEAASQRS
jgi:hypothetical protein